MLNNLNLGQLGKQGAGTKYTAPAPTFQTMSAILDGDSYSSAQIWVTTSTNTERRAAGYWTNLCALTYQMFTTRRFQSYATSGHKALDIVNGLATPLAYVEANNIQAVFIPLGTNDVKDTATSIATLTAYYSTIISTYLNSSARPYVFIGLPTPRGDWEADLEATRATYVTRLHQIRAALTQLVDVTLANSKLHKWDAYSDMVDTGVVNTTTGLTYYPKAAMSVTDGVHMSPIGAHTYGLAAKNMLIAAGLYANPTSLHSIVGAENTNPGLTGTGGSKSVAAITGEVADNCRVERATGSSVGAVCSKETINIFGLPQLTQKIVVSGATVADEEIYFYIDYPEKTGAGYAFNGTDGVTMTVPVKITSGHVGVKGIYAYTRVTVSSTYTGKDMAYVSSANPGVPDGVEWLLRPEPLAVAAGNPTRQQMVIRILMNNTLGNTVTLNIGTPVYKKAAP